MQAGFLLLDVGAGPTQREHQFSLAGKRQDRVKQPSGWNNRALYQAEVGVFPSADLAEQLRNNFWMANGES